MLEKEIKLPLYIKVVFLLIGLFALLTGLYIAKSLIIPLVFALLIAILLNPVVNLFIRIRINRVVAIVITLFLTIVVMAALGALLFSRLSLLSESWPELVDKFTLMLNESIRWTSRYFDINQWKIHAWIKDAKGDQIDKLSSTMGQTLTTIGSGIVILFLIPVYIFLLLFYKPLLLDFIHKLFPSSHQPKVTEIVTKTKTVVQRYLIGLVIELVIMATLNSVALLIIGIDYAILLGVIGAFLNIIPYIGGVTAVALPMMIALATKDTGWYALYVLAAYYFIQLIDNNYIVPKIVASKVKINALFAIIVVLVGNALWGIPGMFLSLPVLAVIKLIFDHIEPLKPWGFLLGDTMPPIIKIKRRSKKGTKEAI
ncbi:MAG: AI-2E family transporter [Bacteroidales bacterium]|nr:AI-2E family transporter [Bacteroidales bacterium]